MFTTKNHTDWNDYFDTIPYITVVDQAKQDELFKTFDHMLSAHDCLTRI